MDPKIITGTQKHTEFAKGFVLRFENLLVEFRAIIDWEENAVDLLEIN